MNGKLKDINFIKEQFEMAKKASHLSETVVMDVKTIDWLIEQAKRVFILEQRNKRISDTAIEQIDITQQRNERLENKVKCYEEALEKIAKDREVAFWELSAKVAREALGK